LPSTSSYARGAGETRGQGDTGREGQGDKEAGRQGAEERRGRGAERWGEELQGDGGSIMRECGSG